MAQTTNYGLALPEETDYYSIHIFNANAEAIDAQMKANEEETSRKAAKTVTLTCTLPASGWSGAAPYSQTVSVSGLTEANSAHVLATAVLSDTQSLAQSQQEAWNMLSRIKAAAGSITATCYEEKPEVDLTVRLEVLG